MIEGTLSKYPHGTTNVQEAACLSPEPSPEAPA